MSPTTVALAAGQVVAFVVVGHAFARLVMRGDRGAPERWLVAILGFVAWSVVLMLVHIATRGWLFATKWAVPLASVACVVIAVALWRRLGAPVPVARRRTIVVLVLLGIVLLALYWTPALLGGSSLRTGDAPWHLGWTHQVLGGDPLPTGPAPVYARNAYPWGHHAVLATMSRLVPGSDPFVAHEALHLILIGAIPLAAACLARLVNLRAGLPAAATSALIGGFGWIAAGSPDFVASPREARYGADLVAASPNSVYQLLPPALPRELGLVLLAIAALLAVEMARRRDLWSAARAGVAIGIVGLVSVPMLVSAVVWVAIVMLAMRRDLRGRAVAVLGGAALATFALWVAPVAVDFLRYGGFVDVTERLGVEWAVPTSLAGWGLLLPLALGGLGVLLTQPPVVRRPLVAMVVAATLLLAVSWMRGRFGWSLLENQTLLHQGRFWPPAHLVGAALGGLGLVALYGWLQTKGTALATGVVAVILTLGAASPVFASIDLTRTIAAGGAGFLYGSDELQKGSFVRRSAAHMGPDDVMLVVEGDLLAFYLWQFSGARIADDDAGVVPRNPWRIRFEKLADRWYERERDSDFNYDWVFSRYSRAPEDVLERGRFRGEEWMFFSSHE